RRLKPSGTLTNDHTDNEVQQNVTTPKPQLPIEQKHIFCWAFQCSHSVGYPDSLCGTACGDSSGWRYADPFGCHQAEGAVYFEETFIRMFDSATTIGLLLTLVMIFSFQGNTILGKPLHNVLIAVPLILQTFLIFAIAYIACRVLKLPYKIAAPAGMIGASNFFELAVAVAIALFGTTSPAALATTVGVLTEVPVMLFLVKNANKTKDWFEYE
uniref:arsenic resistance protein n=1 Tax=Bifidobacterium longum TaxID=216816 RepID=UPI003D189983